VSAASGLGAGARRSRARRQPPRATPDARVCATRGLSIDKLCTVGSRGPARDAEAERAASAEALPAAKRRRRRVIWSRGAPLPCVRRRPSWAAWPARVSEQRQRAQHQRVALPHRAAARMAAVPRASRRPTPRGGRRAGVQARRAEQRAAPRAHLRVQLVVQPARHLFVQAGRRRRLAHRRLGRPASPGVRQRPRPRRHAASGLQALSDSKPGLPRTAARPSGWAARRCSLAACRRTSRPGTRACAAPAPRQSGRSRGWRAAARCSGSPATSRAPAAAAAVPCRADAGPGPRGATAGAGSFGGVQLCPPFRKGLTWRLLTGCTRCTRPRHPSCNTRPCGHSVCIA
jgi:hypothetical protein